MSDTPTRKQREKLASIRDFDELVDYLSDELDWPISRESFEDVDDLFFEFTPEELGIDAQNAAKIDSIKRLRPLTADQPWGIFFVRFEPRRLPVVALRRLLGAVARKKRASANPADRQAWAADDLLFVSNYGEDEERRISFAHFTPGESATDLPTLKVLGWDGQDTALHLDRVANTLHRQLVWPEADDDLEAWRAQWRSAFRLRHRETITTAKDLSVRLAELARDIRDRIRTVLTVESKDGPLRKLLDAFRQSLVADLDEKGFADMYAQTIAYGLLSARIVDPKHRTAEDFAAHMRTSPFLRELMESFISLGGRKRTEGGAGIDFDELGVSEVVELLDEASMEAVVADFGRRKQGEDPVIHFYEDFLTEYDKDEKVGRGVFYTPRPVVSYIVRSVDELLRSEFGLADGLADTTTWGEMAERHADLEIPEATSPNQTFVQILDPATGTGTFLVEVIEIVHATMMEKWKNEGVRSEKTLNERWNEYVPKHLLPRLHGYELMMAPYAIAHLKIGLKLYETGYRFESEERARVYLTNTLEPAQDHSGRFEFVIPALAHEAEAVNNIKANQRFTVVIGNPPYSNFGQLNKNEFILDLLQDYKRDLAERKINLDDDFVKFLRLSQHILEEAGFGLLAMITNNAYLDGITHRRMRKSLITQFKDVRIVDLHGNARRAEVLSDGKADENVFDIMQGVAVGVFASGPASHVHNVKIAHLRGTRIEKYEMLSGCHSTAMNFSNCEPKEPYFLFHEHSDIADEYGEGVPISEVFQAYQSPIQTKRDRLTIHFTVDDLRSVLHDLKSLPESEFRAKYDLAPDGRDWKVADARADVETSKGRIITLGYKPFDFRYTYYTGESRGFLAYPRDAIMRPMLKENARGLVFKRQAREDQEGYSYFFVVDCPFSEGMFAIDPRGREFVAPLYQDQGDINERQKSLSSAGAVANFTSEFNKLLSHSLRLQQPEPHALPACITAEDVFNYIYAVFYSPGYRRRYAQFLKIDFPRLPLSKNLDLFRALAELGGELTSLHLLESPKLDEPSTVFIGTRRSEVERVSWSRNAVWLDRAQTCGFEGVPEEVWNFHIGGYQVCEKWLKDRQAKGGKKPRPGRTLTDEDIAHYQKIIVAISETIRIMGEIDEVIEQHGGWPDAFQSGEGARSQS